MKNAKIIIPILLIIIGISSRFFPHPANFAPIMAIALFAGIYLPKKFSLIIPIITMFISDIFIGFYDWRIMTAVYFSFAIAGLLGIIIKQNKKFSTVLGGTVLGSIIFFLLTNGAVCFFGTMYSHNISGLMQSYLMAIPFFGNSLLGDLFYIGIFVGIMEGIIIFSKQNQYIKNKIQDTRNKQITNYKLQI